MDTAQVVVTVLGAGGGGAVLLALVNGLIKWGSGASARERDKNTDLISQRTRAIEERDAAYRARDEGINAAEKERDEADRKRRQSDEYASSLRRQLLEAGHQPGAWPNDHTIPRPKV